MYNKKIMTHFSQGQLLVDEALFNLQRIAEERPLEEGEFVFIRKLLQQRNFSYKDLSIVALSLLVDSLKTVSQIIIIIIIPRFESEILMRIIVNVCNQS